MAKGKTEFLLRATYVKWLKEKENLTSEGSINCYCMLDSFFDDDDNNFLYFDIIASFLYYNERTYAFSVLYKWYDKLKDSNNKKTYWRKYKKFIESIDVHNENIQPIDSKKLESVRLTFKKTDLAQIDGMDSLINKLGEEEIIKLAVESSFFFNKSIAEDRFNRMIDVINMDGKCDKITKIKKPNTLPARNSQANDKSNENKTNEGIQEKNKLEDTFFYKDEKGVKICNIEKDGNGNAKVCQMINAYTGYNLAYKLEKKPFTNFIISHIWGRAIDPRYFTNLWNIVLVPAWANHLLDKDVDEADSLTSKLKATFMKICMTYYDFSSYSWEDLKMEQPSCKGSYKKGPYNIQIINSICDEELYGAKVGKITVETVKIMEKINR